MPNFLSRIFSNAGGGLIGEIANAADRFIVTAEDRHRFRAELLEIEAQAEAELARIAAQDRDSARNREIILRNTVGVLVQNIAAILMILAFVGLIYIVYVMPVNLVPEQWAVVHTMFGHLGGIVATIIAFWFGSSEGSRRKDENKAPNSNTGGLQNYG